MSSSPCKANLLSERLSFAVKEHCDWFVQQENEELQKLRMEAMKLRDEVARLNEELVSAKHVTGDCKMNTFEDEIMNAPAAVGCSTSSNVQPVAVNAETSATKATSAFTVSSSLTGDDDETASENQGDLQHKFKEMDGENKGYIDIDVLVEHMTAHLVNQTKRAEQMGRYRVAVSKLNRTLGMLAPTEDQTSETRNAHIQFSTFLVIMAEEEEVLQDQFGVDVTSALLEVREGLVDEVIVENLAKHFRVHHSVIQDDDDENEHAGAHRDKVGIRKRLECLSATMILVNALLIGVALDTGDDEWFGWFIFECCFSGFFAAELMINIHLDGFVEYFFGEAWLMSCFDFVIVCAAVFDTLMNGLERLGLQSNFDSGDSYQTSLLRLVRLMRITRILKILRLKVFKDLNLMVNGVIAGLRTLFWAIVLLTFFMYVMGVFMRQVLAEYKDDVSRIMFGSVLRSMLAMFTCFTEGCSRPNGTPFIWYLWDEHGAFLVIVYVSCFVFITFGVLNLIMAVMVENTLANSQKLDAERQFGDDSQHLKKAHELHKLLGKLCRVQGSANSLRKIARSVSKKKGLRQVFEKFRRHFTKETPNNNLHEEATFHSKHLHMRINQDQFDDMMRDTEVNSLLDDLDISDISRGQLFDILDADGSGFLSISELVDGLMRLRGPADKGDVVATGLCVRHLQKQVSKIEQLLQVHFELPQAKSPFCSSNPEVLTTTMPAGTRSVI